MQFFLETTFVFDGIPSQVITWDSTFLLGLLLGFGAFTIATLLWIMVGFSHDRLTLHFVHCPQDGRLAHIAVRRERDGRIGGVQRCSLLSPPTRITCTRGCLAEVRA